jgi:hypothetical protein
MLLKKNILILVEEKKNNLIQSFCHINYPRNVKFWKKFRTLRDKKYKYSYSAILIMTCVSCSRLLISATSSAHALALQFTFPIFIPRNESLRLFNRGLRVSNNKTDVKKPTARIMKLKLPD